MRKTTTVREQYMQKIMFQKLTFDKITLTDFIPSALIKDKKSRLNVCDEPINLSVIAALLIIHPMVVDKNHQLIGGLNTYLELEMFLLRHPHEKKAKFGVLMIETALSYHELELFQNLQNYTEHLFLAKFLPSAGELLSQANQHLSGVEQFKNSLVKQNGQLNHKKFSRELGHQNIRSTK
jgi:hypothetical protein